MSHDSGRPRVWRAALPLALPALGCMLALALALALRPPPVRSHEEQVADALRRSGVAYESVRLGERWPDHINFQYGANVFPYGYRIRLVLAGGLRDEGWLECAELERRCSFTLASRAIEDMPVRDISAPEPLPLPDWLAPYVAQVLP